jgi:YggT family protein
MANSSNILFSLLTTLLDLVICAFLLRVLLQAVRADFYNPISQLIWKLTRPLVDPVARVVPRWRRVDLATALVLAAIVVADILIISALYDQNVALPRALWLGALKLLSLALRLYTLCLLIVTILSWVGPGTANPAANVLWSLTEPLLRPVRRVLPSVSGLDLSPIPVMILFQALDNWLQSLLGLFH